MNWLPFAYFFIVLLFCLPAFLSLVERAGSPVQAVAFKRSVRVYRLLQDQDLEAKSVARSERPSDAVPTIKEAGNHYTVRPLTRGDILRRSDIRAIDDGRRLQDTVAIGIPATAAMALGGELRAGDVVDVTIVPAKDAPAPDPACVLENRWVLDVKSQPQGSASPFVIVLAVPVQCRTTLAGAGGKLSVARRP